MIKIVFIRFAALLITCVIILSCGTQENKTASKNSQSKDTSNKVSFDTTDKSAQSSGNIVVAVHKINEMGTASVWENSKPTTAESLTKSPYSAIGKLVRITGKIYKVEELPPSEKLKGHWASLLLLTGNPNSPLGVTTVEFVYNGDITNIKSGQVITCAGFFAGTYESENSVGGKIEAIALVGNEIRRK